MLRIGELLDEVDAEAADGALFDGEVGVDLGLFEGIEGMAVVAEADREIVCFSVQFDEAAGVAGLHAPVFHDVGGEFLEDDLEIVGEVIRQLFLTAVFGEKATEFTEFRGCREQGEGGAHSGFAPGSRGDWEREAIGLKRAIVHQGDPAKRA